MKFEYDPVKSQSNSEKHGIDFEETQALWDDPERLEIQAVNRDEPRFAVIGRMHGAYWAAIVTYRGETIRIISCRRARKEEVALYEQEA